MESKKRAIINIFIGLIPVFIVFITSIYNSIFCYTSYTGKTLYGWDAFLSSLLLSSLLLTIFIICGIVLIVFNIKKLKEIKKNSEGKI